MDQIITLSYQEENMFPALWLCYLPNDFHLQINNTDSVSTLNTENWFCSSLYFAPHYYFSCIFPPFSPSLFYFISWNFQFPSSSSKLCCFKQRGVIDYETCAACICNWKCNSIFVPWKRFLIYYFDLFIRFIALLDLLANLSIDQRYLLSL